MADTRLMYGATETTAEALLSQSPVMPKSLAQAAAPYIAEFVGTFALVFTVGCCALAPGDLSWNATAIACVLMVMVYATGPVSGGNLNPAVSFAHGLVGSLPWHVVLGYWGAQLAGGISAGFCFGALLGPRRVHLEPGAPFTWEYAAAVEFVYTCTLCFVFLNCAVSRKNNPPDDSNQFYGLAIGFAVAAGGYAAGGISGACFNPAVALGLDASATFDRFTGWSLCWSVFELLGGGVAAALFRIVRAEDFEDVGPDASSEPCAMSKCLSEFLGAFILVLTVSLDVVMASPSAPWSAAAALMCMIYSLGDVSGGHFNPAITLAVFLRGKCSLGLGLAYLASQLWGGILAGLISGAFHAAGPHRDVTFALGPGAGYSPAAAGISELAFTFVLAYVVLACATTVTPAMWRTRQNNYYALAIAGAYAGGGVASAAVSGGKLNPAVCLGMLVSSLSHHAAAAPPATPLANCVAFTFWELVGGMLATAAFRRTHPAEFRNVPLLGK